MILIQEKHELYKDLLSKILNKIHLLLVLHLIQKQLKCKITFSNYEYGIQLDNKNINQLINFIISKHLLQ